APRRPHTPRPTSDDATVGRPDRAPQEPEPGHPAGPSPELAFRPGPTGSPLDRTDGSPRPGDRCAAT
ncbi:hypothetical protein ACWD67_29875, partial [Streptomyces sp. 900116325]